ncbi:MAG: hypothetical protein EA389_05190 [Ilumatobacter sp.]|nr:MAG: hypothetical protein EA389_05190 [Ilumatobacter sp.]
MSGPLDGTDHGIGAGTGYGYDPARIIALRSRSIDAIAALRDIRCDDPLAGEAIRVVRLMCQNLEDSWLPLVNSIHGSTAMVAWRRAVDVSGGPDATGHPCVITRLVDQFGAFSRWIGSTGLDELSDGQLVDRLDHIAERFRRSAAGGGSLLPTWAYLDRILGEMSARLDGVRADGELADLWWDRLGPTGVDRLVHVLDAAGQITDLDLYGDTGPSGHSFERLGSDLATVFGRLAASHPEARDVLVERSTSSTHLAALVASSPDAFDHVTLVTITARLVGYSTGTGEWADRPRVVDRHRDLDELLHALGGSPMLALQLLSDPAIATALATADHVDHGAVEAAVAAALSGPAVDPELLGDAAEVLGDFVAVSADAELNLGTRRGVALAWGTFAPLIAPKLDVRLPVDVVVPASDGPSTQVIHIGTYDELARFVGQVVDDRSAQLALGVVVGAFRADQIRLATSAIDQRPHLTVGDARAQLAAALADVSRMIALVDHAVDRQDQLHAFRHGVARSQATSIMTLLGSMVSWYAPGAPLAGRISTLTTRALTSAIGATRPAAVPDTGLDAHLAVDFVATVLALPLHDATLRARLGLAGVPTTTWRELDGLLDELEAAGDDDTARHRVRARLRAVVDADADLDTYLEMLSAASGESALARPTG